ncbi:fibroin light chain-like [Achroia grisella]|uniref:fibroin light chain-like n=1 Tax=Achroia grisella TaxID=688607 RepID=UPI0027D2E48F|nr:fibroin light chain-like [Achroia grisella]
MLPFVLVLLFATSALAAPSVVISQDNINNIPPAVGNGRPISSALTDRAFEIVDGGDTNIYILTIQQILNDLANQPDSLSQGLAVTQTVAALGELATGIPGNSCDAAALINAYATSVRTGNKAVIIPALANYIRRLASNIGLIAQLATNPDSLRYSSGPSGACSGGGRSYQFEAAWDAVLASANPYQVGLINEEYCAAKRLYSAFNSRSNNVGAAITAATIAAQTQAGQSILPVLTSVLSAVASGGNVAGASAQASEALASAAANVQV